MKFRVLSLAALLVVALLAVVPSFAQDAAPTIADIVVSSTPTDTPEFTTLLAAVQAADPSVLALLSDPEANVTVFAPTDAAFAAALEALGVTAEDLLADQAMLTDVLLYHVVPGTFHAEAITALDGALLGTMLYESPLMITADDMGVKINDSNVVTADIAAENGIVHIIDAVLLPTMGEEMAEEPMMEEAAGTIADVVIASAGGDAPEFTTLLAAVQAADPAILETLTGAGPYTVFAPTDAAFAALLESLEITADDLLADPELLTTVLAYHVVPGHFTSSTVAAVAGVEGGVNVATVLPGAMITLSAADGAVMVNDATVTSADVRATNGIIHVIDAVLLPPTAG